LGLIKFKSIKVFKINYFIFIVFFIFKRLILLIPVLVNVAFVTLLERKILGFSQIRLGPNKVAFIGLIQPFRDAIKLFVKQSENNTNVIWKFFIFRPCLMLIVSIFIWIILPSNSTISWFPLGILTILTLLRLRVYPLLIIGWSSNRKYALIGSIRGVAQTISYEISLALVIIIVIIYYISINIKENIIFNINIMIVLPGIIRVWLMILLAETNRTPFDFSEGESELVSGFNVEYSAIGFVLIFLREYAIIILFSCLTTSLFFSIRLFGFFSRVLRVIITTVWFIIRATLPRYRYDLLMNLAWKSYLPVRLILVIFSSLILSL